MLKEIKIKLYNLLRWSEQYLKTISVYLAKGGFWLTLGQIVSSASSFLLALAFANLLPKETYGIYKYILSIAGILAIPTLQGMGTAVTQAVARGYEGSLVPALKTKLRWGLLGGLASLILAGYYYYQGNAMLAISFLFSAAFLPIMDSFAIYDSLLQGRKLFDVSTKYYIISQIISIASLITAIFFTKNLFLILLAYFLPWTLMRFIFLKITLKKFQPNTNQDPQTITYGKHLSLMGVIGTIANYLDRILIWHFLGAIEVAIYSFAVAIPQQIKSLLKCINILSLPKFSQRNIEEIEKNIWKKISLYFILLSLIVIVYIILAPFIFKLLFPAYLESVKYSQIFAISLIIPQMILYNVLIAYKKIEEAYIFNTIGPISLIVFFFIGAMLWGLWGIILAKVIHRFFLGLILIPIYQKINDTKK